MAVADGEIWSVSDNSDSVMAHSITGCGLFGSRELFDDYSAFFRQGIEKKISFRLIYKLFKSGGGKLQKFSQYNFADKLGLVFVVFISKQRAASFRGVTDRNQASPGSVK